MPSSNADDLSVGDVFAPQADSEQSVIDIPANHRRANAHMGTMSPPEQTAKGLNGFANKTLNENKQRRKKKNNQFGPACATVRGFTLGSGDEESDLSAASSRTPSRPPTAFDGASPLAQASTGHGVSALKLQLSTLNLSDDTAGSGLISKTPSAANRDLDQL
ncbi:hypothetical protein N7527_008214 [Penicillium freii]|nr:hypothetical protein N7527_008214 [Penicillium freii]